MTARATLPDPDDSVATESPQPRRLAHQMAIDAGMAVESPLLRSFDEAVRVVDEEQGARDLQALHSMVDEAFERQVATMFSTPEAFESAMLDAARPLGAHGVH